MIHIAKMSKLFAPMKLGSVELGHRIAMAPLTRYRADDDRVPLPIVKGESANEFSQLAGLELKVEGQNTTSSAHRRQARCSSPKRR